MKDRSYDEITQSHDAEVQTTQKAEKKTETYTFGGKEYLREVTPPHQFKTPLELLHYLWREYDCPAAWGVWKEIWSPAGSGRPKGFWREWKGLRVEIHETDAGHHEYQITNGEDIFAQSSRVDAASAVRVRGLQRPRHNHPRNHLHLRQQLPLLPRL
jgi:hypothetical protein